MEKDIVPRQQSHLDYLLSCAFCYEPSEPQWIEDTANSNRNEVNGRGGLIGPFPGGIWPRTTSIVKLYVPAASTQNHVWILEMFAVQGLYHAA